MRTRPKPLAVTKLAVGMLLLMVLPSCLISGEIDLFIAEQVVTTDVTVAAVGAPVTADQEIRGVWVHGALAASAVAEGRMELRIARPADDPDEHTAVMLVSLQEEFLAAHAACDRLKGGQDAEWSI